MRLSDRSSRANRMRDMTSRDVSRAYARAMGAAPAHVDAAVRAIVHHAPSARAVLDVGTGPGWMLSRLARVYPEASLTGLDCGDEMIAIAREHVEAEGLADRVRLTKASALAMPFPDAAFDLVVTTQFIHVLDDLPGFFREARRVLAPGGNLVVLDQRRDMSWPLYVLMWATTFAFRMLRLPLDGMGPVTDASYTKAEVQAALAEAGFDRLRVTTGAVRLEAWAQAWGERRPSRPRTGSESAAGGSGACPSAARCHPGDDRLSAQGHSDSRGSVDAAPQGDA